MKIHSPAPGVGRPTTKDFRVGSVVIKREPWTFQDWGPIAATFMVLVITLLLLEFT